MGDFEEKLESILNDPQAMSQIMSLAQSLGGASDQSPTAPPRQAPPQAAENAGQPLDPQLISGLLSLLKECGSGEDQRTALLSALRPFVKEKRRAKIDKAIQLAGLSRMARTALELLRPKEEDHV